MNALRFTLCSLLLVVATAPLMAQGTYTQIDFPGATETTVQGINSAGDFVGCYDLGDLNLHGFLYSKGVFTTVDYPGEQQTCWLGINDVGQLVGYASMPDVSLGLSYDRATRKTTLLPPVPNTLGIFASGINNSGTIVGGAEKDNRQRSEFTFRGFILQGTTYTIVEPSPGLDVVLTAINNLGEIIGEKNDFSGVTGSFLYQGGQFTKFLISGHPGAFARAVNDFGVIAGYGNPFVGHHAFVYDNGVITLLFFPGSDGDNVANGINNSGQVVGTYLGGGLTHSFLWTPPADAAKSQFQ